MIVRLTEEDGEFGEKTGLLFQLLHSGEVENSWSVPLLETIFHSYCQGGGQNAAGVYGDPPMELYLSLPGAEEFPAKKSPAGAFLPPVGSSGSSLSAAASPSVAPSLSTAPSAPTAAFALTGEILTLCPLARFSSPSDWTELRQFARLHQVRQIVCGEQAARMFTPTGPLEAAEPSGWLLEQRPAMVWKGALPPEGSLRAERPSLGEGAALSVRPRLDDLYALLSMAYPGFSTPRDFWIFDTSRRIRRGCARIFAALDPEGRLLATAGCYAIGRNTALLSGVATHPDARRRGYGSALVWALASKLSADGKSVWIIPVDRYAWRLYSSIGFTASGNYHCILQRNGEYRQFDQKG